MTTGLDPNTYPLILLLFNTVANELAPAAKLIYGGREESISGEPAKILALLMNNPHRVFTREQIIEEARLNIDIFDTSVLSHLNRPRRAIERLTGRKLPHIA